jgi:hypothetical protein
MDNTRNASFHERLNGRFHGMLKWQQLDALWQRVKTDQWYFYQVGEALPGEPLCGDELAQRINALDALLRQEHAYDFCGIVYADDGEHPTLIKVYDPNNIGSSCSRSTTPTLPGWILSLSPPSLLEISVPVPGNRKRWWQRFSLG